MDLKELIEQHRRGRSVDSLGRALGRTGNTVRGWASGKYPLPEYQAAPMAEWLGVTEAEVVAASEHSRRVYMQSVTVGAIRDGSSTAARAVGERATPMQVQAVRDFIAAQQEVLAAQRKALDALLAAFEEDD